VSLDEIFETHDSSKDGDANAEDDDRPILHFTPSGTIWQVDRFNKIFIVINSDVINE
jgi:hypothetical protein